MANPFDQFDGAANPFDQFDAGPSIFEQRPAAKPFEYGPASEALGGLMDIGAMIGTGGAVAAKQIAERPVQPLVDVARGAVALPMMAGQAAMGDVQAQQQLRGLPADIYQSYAQAYGSPKAAFMTAATEPGRFATDIMGVPSFAGGVARGAAGVASAPLRGVAEMAYTKGRQAFAPQNRMLMDVFGEPEIQAALQEAPAGYNVMQALADVNAPRAQAVAKQAMEVVPEATRATQLAQEQARIESLGRVARTPEELKAAEKARSASATENYREAFKQAAPEIPEEFLQRDSMKKALKAANKIDLERGGGSTPVQKLHDVKVTLDDIVKDPTKYKLKPSLGQALKNTRAEFIDYLNTVPEYARARAEFASQSVPINQMQVAQTLFDSLIEPVTEGATRGGMFARAVTEAPKTIKKATGEQFFDELKDVLSPEAMDVVDNIKEEFRRTKLADEQARLGAAAAPEVGELASAKISPITSIRFLNSTWTIANSLIKRTLGQIDEATAVKIGMLMQDPAELNRAIAAARKYARETKQGAERIRAPLPPVTPAARARQAIGAVNVMSQAQNRNAMAR